MSNVRAGLLLTASLTASLALMACGGANPSATAPGGPAATTASGNGATTPPAGGNPSQPTVGGNPSQPAGGATNEACALLNADDIREVTGLETQSATPGSAGGIFATGCHWVLADTGGTAAAEMILGLMATGGREFWTTSFKASYGDLGYQPIEGLGDEAAGTDSGGVVALQGDALIDLQYIALQPTDSEMATGLMRKALAKLGS